MCRASAIIQSVEVFDRPEDNRNVILIDTLGGDNIRITGAFFGNARHFQGYGVGQARYGDRYDGRNCYIDDSYLGGKATIIVDFTSSNGGSDTSIVKLDALICKTVVV